MALFKTKKKTVAYTSFSRLIEDKDIPDLSKVAMNDYMYDYDNRSKPISEMATFADYYKNQISNSVINKMQLAKNWADKNYIYGLPKASTFNERAVNIEEILDDYLERKEDTKVDMVYATFGPINTLHAAWQILQDKYDYNGADNTLLHNGKRVALEDMQVKYSSYTMDDLTDPDYLFQLGYPAKWGKTPKREVDIKRSHTSYVVAQGAALDTIEVHLYGGEKITLNTLDYEPPAKPPENGLGSEDNTGVDIPYEQYAYLLNADYISGQYTVVENGVTKMKVFTYRYNSGEIPELDGLYSTSNALGSYYPNLYFRLNSKMMNENTDSEEFKSLTVLARKMGLSYDDLTKSIEDEVEDLEDVTQIVLAMQLGINTTDKASHNYFYEYFMQLYLSMPKIFADTHYSSETSLYINGMAKSGTTHRIEDKAYITDVGFSAIGYVDYKGRIGEVGFVFADFKDKDLKGGMGAASVPVHTFMKQLTPNTYRVLEIRGLYATQYVDGGYSTTVSGGDENLYIPVDSGVLNKITGKEKAAVLSRAMVLIFNTKKVIKTKWYQSGIFKAIMFVVAVAISVYTGGAGATLLAVGTAIAQTVVVGLVLSLAVKIMVQKLGIDLGAAFMILAVVMVALGGAAALSNTGSIMGATASQFIQAANYAVSISSQASKYEMEKTLKAHNEFINDLQGELDNIEQLREELGLDTMKSPSFLLADSYSVAPIRLGESIDTFITRNLSTEMGLIPLMTITSMFEITVRLPSRQETLQRIYDQIGINREE